MVRDSKAALRVVCRLGSRLRRADVKLIAPVVVTLGLLAFVSLIAAAPASGGELLAIVQRTWWVALLLTIPYIGARAMVWHELLEQLKVAVPWRLTLLALAGGEIAKTLPGGVYLQNYILARSADLGETLVVRSATATTATLGMESALALPVALIIGLPNAPWLPRMLLGAVATWLVLLTLLWLLIHHWQVHLAAGTPRRLRHALLIAEEVFAAAAQLVTWRTFRTLAFTAVYMLVYVAELHLVATAVGVSAIGFRAALGIYSIVVLAVILVPLPTKLGATELTGLTALVAYGAAAPLAAVIMLGLRLVATGATMLVAAVLMLVLRREFARPRGFPSTPTALPSLPLDRVRRIVLPTPPAVLPE